MRCSPSLLANSKWHLRDGNCSFWFDVWHRDEALRLKALVNQVEGVHFPKIGSESNPFTTWLGPS